MDQDHQVKDLIESSRWFPKKSLYWNLNNRQSFRVFFYRNGDRHNRPFKYVVSHKRQPDLQTLMDDLSQSVFCLPSFLPSGVRHIFTLEGQSIHNIDELEENKYYVCSSNCCFDQLDYASIQASPEWHCDSHFSIPRLASHRYLNLAKTKSLVSQPAMLCSRSSLNNTASRIIYIVAHSASRPRRVQQFLLNCKTAPFFEKLMGSISTKMALSSGPVQKIYNFYGEEVTTLSQFFDASGIFFAVGNEHFNKFDQKLTVSEMKKIDDNRKNKTKNRKDVSKRKSINSKVKMDSSEDITLSHGDGESNLYDEKKISELKTKYEIGNVLAQRDFTTIRECMIKNTENVLALKEIDLSICSDPEKVESEISVLLRLKHYNIYSILDMYRSNNHIYLITEIYQAGNILHQLLESANYSECDVSGILFHLACALSYLHSKKIVHRDVRLENLMVQCDANGSKILKLCDFGLAANVSDEPLTEVCGTALYMAPEIFKEKGYSTKVDVWSSGIVAALLLTGKFPHGCDSEDHNLVFNHVMNLNQIHLAGSQWGHVSNLAKDFVRQCLFVDPIERFSSDEMLIFPWIKDDLLPNKENISSKTVSNLCKLMPDPRPTPLQQALSILKTSAADKGPNYFICQS